MDISRAHTHTHTHAHFVDILLMDQTPVTYLDKQSNKIEVCMREIERKRKGRERER